MMPILKKTGCVPVVISFFVISMLCFMTMFAPIQWIMQGINLPKLFAAACLMSVIMTIIAFFSLRDISPTKSMLIEKMRIQALDAQYAQIQSGKHSKQTFKRAMKSGNGRHGAWYGCP